MCECLIMDKGCFQGSAARLHCRSKRARLSWRLMSLGRLPYGPRDSNYSNWARLVIISAFLIVHGEMDSREVLSIDQTRTIALEC